MRSETDEYELMSVVNNCDGELYSGDLDSEPMAQGDALKIIRYLLKSDLTVAGYKLVKRKA